MTPPPKAQPVEVPDWAHDAVWYQLFPERFRNGAPTSNPQRQDIADREIPGWQITPWGQDWYRPDAWAEPAKWRFAILGRRYGGDLVGVREKLDYLQALGVNALYLNPIFTARSLHKYDGASFHHVDPTLGPDREGDWEALAAANETDDPATWIWTAADRYFLELVREVHARGMRIILDGVFNHTGREFFAFQDILKRGRQSPYADWYLIDRWHRDGTFKYKGWFGHDSLPEFNRTKDSLWPPVRDYVFNCTRRWMDPAGDGDRSKGIDGWRLDVAFCVPHGFWREWRQHVKAINPDAYLTAEIIQNARDFVQGDQFDAVMNYMWMYPAVAYFAPSPHRLDMRTFKRKLDALRASYPPEVTPVLQNLLDSHDVGRILSMLENAGTMALSWDEYFNVSRVKHNPSFVTTKPGPAAYRALRQLVIFQMTYPGAPMIYYGTEVGMWGANDPCNRQPMFWDDIPFEPETHTPAGKNGSAHPRQPDKELFAFFERAIQLRKTHRALRRGTFAWESTGRPGLLGFTRQDESQTIHVLLNVRDKPVAHAYAHPVFDLWDPAPQPLHGPFEVPAHGWRIVAQ